jgi:predicted nucleic-acid-binding Zn-ribbon protein
MAYYPDLERLDYFPVDETTILKAVGWLNGDHDFTTGRVSQDFFDRLNELMEIAWQPLHSMGCHVCELCQFSEYEKTATGQKNIFIPFDGAIFVAPELILHYINVHHYLPPNVFVEAVMKCPTMGSMDYKKALLKNGGKGLSKLATS